MLRLDCCETVSKKCCRERASRTHPEVVKGTKEISSEILGVVS
jgi:hypothetical protein